MISLETRVTLGKVFRWNTASGTAGYGKILEACFPISNMSIPLSISEICKCCSGGDDAQHKQTRRTSDGMRESRYLSPRHLWDEADFRNIKDPANEKLSPVLTAQPQQHPTLEKKIKEEEPTRFFRRVCWSQLAVSSMGLIPAVCLDNLESLTDWKKIRHPKSAAPQPKASIQEGAVNF